MHLDEGRHNCTCDCSASKCQGYFDPKDKNVCFGKCENNLCKAIRCEAAQGCVDHQCVPRVCETNCGDEGCPELTCPTGFDCLEQQCRKKAATEPEPTEDPKPTADGVTTTESAHSTGDPHLKTIDGLTFDVQAPGEFVMLELVDEPLGPRIQARTQRLATDICPHVTWNTAVAASVGESQVAVYADRQVPLWVDGEASALSIDEALDLGSGSSVRRSSANRWEVSWSDGALLVITKVAIGAAYELDLGLHPSTLWRMRTRGLLGNYDGVASNDLVRSDGAAITEPISWLDLYRGFIASYRISAEESLFDYQPGETTQTFLTFDVPSAPVLATALPADLVENARAICELKGVKNEAL